MAIQVATILGPTAMDGIVVYVVYLNLLVDPVQHIAGAARAAWPAGAAEGFTIAGWG